MDRGTDSHNISSQSRSKLNAFRYGNQDGPSPDKTPQKTGSEPGHANKENQTSWLNGVVEDRRSETSNQKPSTETTEPKTLKECPHTPGNRIPLADLINNAEDAFNQAPMQEFTPEDYVIWQHVPVSSNPDGTPGTQRRKRRHSSSPTSSPLAGTSKSRRKRSLDLQNYQGLIKTPQNDLATDLWNSYVSKTLANGNGELLQPRLTNLLSSSPQTPASMRTSRDSSGLRRSNSCMAEWPSSKAKRRRIDKEKFGTGRSIFSRTRSNVVDSGNYQSPNISSLVKQIEKTLQKVPRPPPDRSDESPVPARNHVRRNRSASPTEDRKGPALPSRKSSQVQEPRVIHVVPEDRKPLEESSSDYGDDDFDQDFFDLAEASMDPFVDAESHHHGDIPLSEKRVNNNTPTDIRFSAKETNDTGVMNTKIDEDKPTNNDNTLDADEFDDDFDGISDDMEDLLAECDNAPSTKLASIISTETLAPKQPISVVGSGNRFASTSRAPNPTDLGSETPSGDEFDDDGLDLEAIEQSMVHSGAAGSNNVCHS
ncbi:bifunctional ATP-dependent DNA helicase/ssDNA endodeoxyribonuclease DNA2 [Aspergillus ibericus CBS 121593]|uniref:Uncharacterized protein n=1 Tax=Aspergillus ibericus CBS 121593 TaxID=1448316 RepID=A0A395GZI7_9EURO|nr:hypothetical protein BO80DRAFT_424979 [Aspergillus ibericus CBS 121593]RAL01007.1 hypothetical protein BO80DRAFT_424979 [Aspergillus ibericus CBS 121593]